MDEVVSKLIGGIILSMDNKIWSTI